MNIAHNMRKKAGALALCLFALLSPMLTACSEEDDTVNDYENWEARNAQFFAALEDSLKNDKNSWMKFKSYSKNPSDSVGTNYDYIYVKVIPTGYEPVGAVDSPMFNDSVAVSYEGRLMPSDKEPQGYLFDSSVYNTYNVKTNAIRKFVVSGLVDGFTTALLHMHRFDTWRVYIPYTLGYGTTDNGSIPAYSTLVFTITLYEFAPEGTALPKIGVTN